MNMDLLKRCENFLTELSVPVTAFSAKVGLSPQALYSWRRGKLILSKASLQRIDDYLSKYGF